MSRNPYLAASRPSSSYTRSSRTSSRTGAIGGGLLGRSRSSASLGGFGGHSTSLYGSKMPSGYIPQWQRSSSSTRSDASLADRTSTPRARTEPTEDATSSAKASAAPATGDAQDSRDTVNWQSTRSLPDNSRTNLYKSTSSHSLADKRNERDNDQGTSSNHLQNYQESKLQQSQTPQQARSTTRASRSSLQSTDSTDQSESDSTRKSTGSLTDSFGTAVSEPTTTDNEDSIGDNIPSGSARHLRSQQGQLLSKSKSLELSSANNQQSSDSPLLHGSMSVDRLLLRADSMGERDLRRSFKELVMENERLKQQLKGFDEKDKQRQQDWIRQERQLHRKISELEEENKQIERWKQEIQRLKDENNSLIRVVSKLTKQHH